MTEHYSSKLEPIKFSLPLMTFIGIGLEHIRQEPHQSSALASQLQSLEGLSSIPSLHLLNPQQPQQHMDLLDKILRCECILKKLSPKFKELVVWIVSYQACVQETHCSDQEIPNKEIAYRCLLQISMKVSHKNSSNVFYMHFLAAIKKNGWNKQFCEDWVGLKKQFKNSQAIHQITLQLIIDQQLAKSRKNNERPKIVEQSLILEKEQKQSTKPNPQSSDQTKVQSSSKETASTALKETASPNRTTHEQKMRRDLGHKKRYKQRMSALSELLKSRYCISDEQQISRNVASLCQYLISHVDLFMAETISKIVKRAKICNEKLDSEKFGDEFRYFSPTGFNTNSSSASRKCKHLYAGPKPTRFYQLSYPSKLEQFNCTQVNEYQEEQRLHQIIKNQQKSGVGLHYEGVKLDVNRKPLKSYLLAGSNVEEPIRKTQADVQRNKKRLIIKYKFVENLLFCDPIYSTLYAYDKIFM